MDKAVYPYLMLNCVGVVSFWFGLEYLLRPGPYPVVGVIAVLSGLVIVPLASRDCIRASRRSRP